MSTHIPKLVAHRGYMSKYPENTRLSILQAIKYGAHYVEFDVQCSQDGELMVIHDDTLQRTTEYNDSVFSLSCKQLQNISAHDPKRFGITFKDEHIISLAQMMEAICTIGNCHAFVEIKQESLLHFGYEPVIAKLIETLKPYQQRTTIISFDQRAIASASKDGFNTGWVLDAYTQQQHDIATQLQPQYLICNYKKLNSSRPWSGAWQWMLYDIVDPRIALHYAQLGVDFIETEAIEDMQNSAEFTLQH